MKKRVFIRFERPQHDFVGAIVGPYEWVQLTYNELRTSPDGDTVAFYVDGLWEPAGHLIGLSGYNEDDRFSDIVISGDSAE